MQLEIAVQDLAGARAAHAGGADRVELCAALRATGGLTPSAAMVEGVVGLGLLPVHVLVRPRPGGFVHDADEVAVMERDIRHLRARGAAGVVVGAMTPAGTPDVDVLRRLAEAAESLDVTWHRMMDAVNDPLAALASAAELGVTRVLTSGGATRALDGADTLSALVRASAGRVQVMAGGGVRPEHVGALARTGVAAVHLSAGRPRPGPVSGPGGGPSELWETDRGLVTAARAAVDAVGTPIP